METLQPQSLLNNRYRVVRFIANGGFGCTYEAIDNATQQRVAIKELFVRDLCTRRPNTSDVILAVMAKAEQYAHLRKKFIDEASMLMSISHPGIVKVTDVFTQNNTDYFVMSYIDGESLSERVSRQGPISQDEALGYIRQVAEALNYIHSQHRLHLDIKPSNILVDTQGRAILIDFGVAKQYDETYEENHSQLMGKTPNYSPIEQYSGTVTKFSPATDIYALGATLYKLLTGITPPPAADQISEKAILGFPPNTVAPQIERAIRAAMKIRLADRPQTIQQFLALLPDDEEATVVNVEGGITTDNTPRITLPTNTPRITLPTKPVKPKSTTKLSVNQLLVIFGAIIAALIVTLIIVLLTDSGSKNHNNTNTAEETTTTHSSASSSGTTTTTPDQHKTTPSRTQTKGTPEQWAIVNEDLKQLQSQAGLDVIDGVELGRATIDRNLITIPFNLRPSFTDQELQELKAYMPDVKSNFIKGLKSDQKVQQALAACGIIIKITFNHRSSIISELLITPDEYAPTNR